MPSSPFSPPLSDPTPIFELYRGSYATELLVAAVKHFNLIEHLAHGPLDFAELQKRLDLAERPLNVLLTAIRAMGLIVRAPDGRFDLPAISREHLIGGGEFDVSDYLGLAASNPGVGEMVERLRSNRPAGSKPGGAGAAFIYRDGIESAMETEVSARKLTLALAGRAKNVAPVLAARVPLANARRILDIGGGTGIYSIAMLQRHPQLRAVIFDRAEVLKVAREMATSYGVLDRMEFTPGDMFRDAYPTDCDVILLSNILHDWDTPECRQIIARAAAALPPQGRLLIHDAFLNDDLGGPLPIALYSASLFTLTEGRAYSAAEYRHWLENAGLRAGEIVPTLIHCGVLVGTKP